MRQRGDRASSRRRPSDAAKRRQLLVFTEGLRTEPVYLTHWYRNCREHVIVRIDPRHGDPLYLVQTAADDRSADIRDAQRDRGDAYDEYWCVFDVDEHPRLRQALELAARSGISVALSNPCIELWFLLHFQDRTAALERAEAQRLVRQQHFGIGVAR
jgi:hypothetical protein